MAAWHHLNTDQSGYWVDPEEHISRLKHSGDLSYMRHMYNNPAMGMNTMFRHKVDEGMEPEGSSVHGSGLYDDVSKSMKIRQPISLAFNPHAVEGDPDFRTSPKQVDGHHRVAIAAALQAETGQQIRVPVDFMHPDHVDWDSSSDWRSSSDMGHDGNWGGSWNNDMGDWSEV